MGPFFARFAPFFGLKFGFPAHFRPKGVICMPKKGDLVVKADNSDNTVYEIVRMVRSPAGAVLLSGDPELGYQLTLVPQAQFGQWRMYEPPIEPSQRWADERGRVHQVVAVFTFNSVPHVAYSPLDEGSLNVVPEEQFRLHGQLIME